MELDCQIKSGVNKQTQQHQDSTSNPANSNSNSRHLIIKYICNWNPTEIALLLCFLFVFTLLIIVKGPSVSASSSSPYALFSRFIDGQSQLPNQAASKSNITKEISISESLINITKSPHKIGKQDFINITNSPQKIGKQEFINIPKKNYTYDKLLGGLLPEGLNEISCLSRYRWNFYRKTPPPVGRNPSNYLISKLRDYELLHKQCGPYTSPYKAAVELLHKKKKKTTAAGGGGSDYTACKYIIWNHPPGLGNRMLSLVSTFLYALLTNRVLLLRQERGSDMSELFCEPFPASSWLLPNHFSYGGNKIFDRSFPYRFGNMVNSNSFGKTVPPIMFINLNNRYEDNDRFFFCDEHQTHLQKVNWLLVSSNQYYAPYLFFIPAFQQELDKLFPEKQTVFHHLGRYLYHPSNDVWGLITRYYEGYLSQADEKIGIQIRVFHDQGQKGPVKQILDQILGCITKENLLPKQIGGKVNQEKTKKLAVLVTSLKSGYLEELRKMYRQNTSSGEAVAFYQPSHEELQRSGDQMHDMKALAEIYLLSLTDKLVISGRSTFGYVAYGLGGLKPWILQQPSHGNTFCKHSLSMDPCFHYPPQNLVCGKNSSNTLTYVRHCADKSIGIKLFNKLES